MTVPAPLRWVLIAVAGLLIAVAVAVLASKLTSQRIGLASEPLDAGRALAPAPRHAGHGDSGRPAGGNGQHPTTSTATTTAPPTVSTTTGDDSGSEAEGGGSSEDD